MPFPTPTSRRSWLLAGGILASAGLGATAVAGPAWANSPGSSAPIPAVATAAVRGGAAPAPRQGPNSLATAKARIERRIDAFVARIDRATNQAENDPNLAGLAGKLAALRQQLVELRKQVAAATDVATVRSEVQAALKSARNDALLQEVVVLRADRLSMALGKLESRVPAVQSRLAAAQARGTDTSRASSALVDLRSKLGDAEANLRGLAPDVLSGATSLTGARSALQAARADAKAVRAYVQRIRQALGGSQPRERAGGRRPR